jgi:hypothetical protein
LLAWGRTPPPPISVARKFFQSKAPSLSPKTSPLCLPLFLLPVRAPHPGASRPGDWGAQPPLYELPSCTTLWGEEYQVANAAQRVPRRGPRFAAAFSPELRGGWRGQGGPATRNCRPEPSRRQTRGWGRPAGAVERGWQGVWALAAELARSKVWIWSATTTACPERPPPTPSAAILVCVCAVVCSSLWRAQRVSRLGNAFNTNDTQNDQHPTMGAFCTLSPLFPSTCVSFWLSRCTIVVCAQGSLPRALECAAGLLSRKRGGSLVPGSAWNVVPPGRCFLGGRTNSSTARRKDVSNGHVRASSTRCAVLQPSWLQRVCLVRSSFFSTPFSPCPSLSHSSTPQPAAPRQRQMTY